MADSVDPIPTQAEPNRFPRMMGRQAFLSRVQPFVWCRWLVTMSLLTVFMLRIVLEQGWYIVCYAHAIYLLHLLKGFLQPKPDPSPALQADLEVIKIEEGRKEGSDSPSQSDVRASPPVQPLPEMQFWVSATRGTIIAFCCSYAKIFNIPTYWPILFVYFCALSLWTLVPVFRKRAAPTVSAESGNTSCPKEELSGNGEQPPPPYDEKQGETPGVLPSAVNPDAVDTTPDGVLDSGNHEGKVCESV